MSHEELAGGPARSAKRRKVEFRTTLEDLEGRLLLSSTGLLRNRKAVPMVRQQGQGNAARLRAQVQPRAMAAARNQQAVGRFAMMNGRLRNPGIRINVSPTINVQPNINVGGPTSNSVANPTVNVPVTTPPTTTLPNAQTTPPTTTPTTQTPTQPTNQNPTNQNPTTPTNQNPTNPTRPGRPNPGSWTDVTKPGGQTPTQPTTPTTPTTPVDQTPTTPTQPTDPTPTTPADPTPTDPTPTDPTPTDPTPTDPTPTDPTPVNQTPTTPSHPAPTFPNGTIVRNEQTGELGYYQDGKRGLISPPVAAKMGLKVEQTTAVTVDDFNAIPRGPDYFPDGMFVRNDQTGEISRYSDGALHVVSTPVLNYLGVGVSDVATIAAAQYAGVNKGSDYFPEGTLIQNQQTGEIDIYQAGERHWISVPVASRLNLQPSQLVVISPTQFNGVTQGKDYFPNGVYLQNQETGEIARYDSGQRSVVSSPIASKLGLTASDLIPVSAGQYNAVTKGPDYFVEGMFLQNNQSGELANYSGGQRHWVSPSVSSQLNLTPAMITAIGADQFNAIPRGGDYTPPAPTPLDPTMA